MEKIDKTKFYKGEKFRLYEWRGTRRHLRLCDLQPKNIRDILADAVLAGLAKEGNDAPRGGKTGDFIEITKYFSLKSLEKHLKARKKAIKKTQMEFAEKEETVLKSEKIRWFSTISDVGDFVIDGAHYSNFWGDGENRVEVCECDFTEFQKAECIHKVYFA